MPEKPDLKLNGQLQTLTGFIFFLGQLSPLPYGHVVTGVAIASTKDPLAIYFGCYSDKTTVGGTGMIRVSSLGTKQVW